MWGGLGRTMIASSRLKALAVGFGHLLARNSRSRVVVLCYHSVHPEKSFASATPTLFRLHLEWLAENCDIVPFDAALPTIASLPRRRPTVVVTLDDGYADNFDYAFPLIQCVSVPVTFFICAGLVRRDPLVVARFRRLRRSDDKGIRPLSWSQLREIVSAGHSIGAHTYSHPNLASLDLRAVEAELTASKGVLEDGLGQEISLMAYPFGKPRVHFTRETEDVVAQCGYKAAATAVFRAVRFTDSPYAIPRISVVRDGIEALAEKVYGAWDLFGLWHERSPLWLRRLVSPEDFASIT